MRASFLIALVLVLAGCLPSGAKPLPVTVTRAAWPAWPVVYILHLNGTRFFSPDVAASGAGDLPPSDGHWIAAQLSPLPNRETQIDVELQWLELHTNRAYTASFTLDPADLPSGGLPLIFRFARHGEIAVYTQTPDTATYPALHVECAARAPALDRSGPLFKARSMANPALTRLHRNDPVRGGLCPDPQA